MCRGHAIHPHPVDGEDAITDMENTSPGGGGERERGEREREGERDRGPFLVSHHHPHSCNDNSQSRRPSFLNDCNLDWPVPSPSDPAMETKAETNVVCL